MTDSPKTPFPNDRVNESGKACGADAANQRILLSPAQREICIGQQLDPESPLYNMGMLYVIEGELDSKKFIESWNTVVERSDALRIRLQLTDGEAVQVAETHSIKTTELDFSQRNNAVNEAKAWIQSNLEKPMPLQGALVESTLLKLSSDKWMWFCKQHHIITDASSYASIWQQIRTLYICIPDSNRVET